MATKTKKTKKPKALWAVLEDKEVTIYKGKPTEKREKCSYCSTGEIVYFNGNEVTTVCGEAAKFIKGLKEGIPTQFKVVVE